MLTVEDRFWAKVKKTETCWLWTGKTDDDGYGLLYIDRPRSWKRARAHRLMAAWTFGMFDQRLVVRHTCRTPGCVNPEHLRLGTVTDNNRDTVRDGTQWQVRKTHCPRGHEYTPENTYQRKDHPGRQCRACDREKKWEMRH
jgi:hypothetical protein